MADKPAFVLVRKGNSRARRGVRATSKGGVCSRGVSARLCLPLTIVPQSSLVLWSKVGPGRASSPRFGLSPVSTQFCNTLWRSEVKACQLYQTLCDTIDCSPPGSSVHGILKVRILEWVAVPSCRGSSWPKDQTHVFRSSCVAGGLFTAEPPRKPDSVKYSLGGKTAPSWEPLGQTRVGLQVKPCSATCFYK